MSEGARWSAGIPEDRGLDVLVAMLRATGDGLVFLDRDLQCVFATPTACTMLGNRLDELQAGDSMIRPEVGLCWERDRLAPVFGGKPARWATVLRRPDGSELDIECIAARLEFGSGELMVVVLRDVSERRRRAREAIALAQAAASTVSDSIDATVQALAESALRGTRALGATVLLNDDEECAVWIGAAGLPAGIREGLRAAARAGGRLPDLYHVPVMAQRMVVDPDTRQHLEGDPRDLARVIDGLKSMPWQAAVFAPLVYQGTDVGLLLAIFREGEQPSAEERAFLATLADQGAVAAMNARLMAQARDKVTLEERQRLARELHDSVSQALYGIGLGARTARDLLEHDPAREPIDYVLQLAAVGLAEMRALIFELRPESLESEGLVAALGKQVEALGARHGIAARTIARDEPPLSLEVKQALYRIAQEALQNTIKHAHARRADVRLEVQGSEVLLAIEDDGAGFDPGGTFPGHLGLRSMRERALGVGGSFEVTSAPRHGTRILVSVPMPAKAHAGRR